MPLRLLLTLILLASFAAATSAPAAEAVPRLLAGLERHAAEAIGCRIWRNEAAGRRDWLVHWLPGEDHLSLGIGHFIWYPEGRRGPFLESFPEMLAFLERSGVAMPAWLDRNTPSPWPDRAAFLAAHGDPRLEDLRAFLVRTVAAQTAFMADRLARAVPAMLEVAPQPAEIARHLDWLLRDDAGRLRPKGVYALIDYVNFKGEGTDPGEKYNGTGWGLLQVLEAMSSDHDDPEAAFAAAAAEVLARRTRLAPPERQEERWLDGWLTRIGTYRTFELPPRPAAGLRRRPAAEPATQRDRRGPGAPWRASAPACAPAARAAGTGRS